MVGQRRKGRPALIEVGYRPEVEGRAKITKWERDSPAGRVLLALRLGAPRHIAAKWAGIDRTTVFKWAARGREHEDDDPVADEDQVFVDFFNAQAWVGAMLEIELVAFWRSQAMTDWRAARDLLARRFPEEWGDPSNKTRTIIKYVRTAFDPEYTQRILANPKALEAALALDNALLGEDGGFDEDD